ncbi:LPS export ABC transporter periplasmic protein LptC [Vibrio hepatarius]|jgi:lipopolysaccharide export system protein LptC|uniref:Lipopolysaccharide export system protein LptC n=1 Tax=Vibrio hepatarius TaxID=171383 RepID=A0A0M0I1A7_9VIBR|nr:LPS export ABC transporter periplasmic protein LptC [Vibrio hepatarius]KOO08095.1 lipopolysaccharide assembly protein [Vibrio hepatarius]
MSLSRIGYLLAAFALCWSTYYYLTNDKQSASQVSPSLEQPMFSGKNLNNTSYDESGVRSYVITSLSLDYYAKSGDTVFNKPVLKVFKEGSIQEWEITAKTGVLDKDHILTLTNDVVVKNLLPESGFDTLNTLDMSIRLDNRDFWADNQVIIYGPQFETIGQAMKGNFADHSATLYKSVQGRYETLTP